MRTLLAIALSAGLLTSNAVGGSPVLDNTCNGTDDNGNGQVDEGISGVCSCAPPSAGPVAWWRAEGNAADAIGNHDGVLANGTIADAHLSLSGNSFRFDGVDDHVAAVGAASSFAFIQNTGIFTINAWTKVTGQNAQHAVTSNTATTTEKGHFFLWERVGAQWRLRLVLVKGVSGSPVIDSASPVLGLVGGWHHVAVVGDGATVTFWIDGVAYPGSGVMGPRSTGNSTRSLELGRCAAASSLCQLEGGIDEVQIHDRALAPAEILSIYQAERGGSCALCTPRAAGLVGWWPGDGPIDISGNGRNGSLTGGATFTPGKVERAFALDGVDDSIAIPGTTASYAFIQNTGIFTINAWTRITGTGAEQAITSNTPTTTEKGHYFLWETVGAQRRLRLHLLKGISSTSVIETVSPFIPADTGWHHVAAVGNGSTITFWIDGVAYVGPGVMGPKSTGDSTRSLELGRCAYTMPLCQLGGSIDEVQIHDRTLTADEILAIREASGIGVCRCTDADGDGYGPGVETCSAGTSDCDDADPLVWRRPVEVEHLTLTGRTDTTLSWSDQSPQSGPAISYDVVRGTLGSFPVGTGIEACLSPAPQATSVIDSTLPASGSGFWYVVRADNPCCAGSYGRQSDESFRTSSTCPSQSSCVAEPAVCVGDDPSLGHCDFSSDCPFPEICDTSVCIPSSCSCEPVLFGSVPGHWECTIDCRGLCVRL